MSIQEAVRLVLTAGTLGQRGEVFVLDMGHKIKIVEIAQRMLRLYGRSDIPIVFTGLRPGEKLTEELIGGLETTEPTQFRKVSCVKAPPLTVDVAATVKDIERRLPDLTDADIGKIMHRTVQLVKQAQKEQRAVA